MEETRSSPPPERTQPGASRAIAQRLTRLYTGPDGLAYAEALPLPWDQALPVGRIRFGKTEVGEAAPPAARGWHPSPNRRYYVTLSGSMEIELSGTGERLLFEPGHLILAEDTTGKGHVSTARPAGEEAWVFLIIDIDPATQRS